GAWTVSWRARARWATRKGTTGGARGCSPGGRGPSPRAGGGGWGGGGFLWIMGGGGGGGGGGRGYRCPPALRGAGGRGGGRPRCWAWRAWSLASRWAWA